MSSIRSESGINTVSSELQSISSVITKIIDQTDNNRNLISTADPIVQRLKSCRSKIESKNIEGRKIVDESDGDAGAAEWKTWTQSLPPVAFEVVRETKELVHRIDNLGAGGADDFS